MGQLEGFFQSSGIGTVVLSSIEVPTLVYHVAIGRDKTV